MDRSAETRRQILEATIQCLDQWGYGAVTNIKVADAAGVSRGAMMHHFPTRQALIVATIEFAYEKQSVFRTAELAKVPPGWIATARSWTCPTRPSACPRAWR